MNADEADERGSEKDRVIGKSGNRVIEKQSRLTTTMTEEDKEAANSKSKTLPRMNAEKRGFKQTA
jgi:hypothetical protein